MLEGSKNMLAGVGSIVITAGWQTEQSIRISKVNASVVVKFGSTPLTMIEYVPMKLDESASALVDQYSLFVMPSPIALS